MLETTPALVARPGPWAAPADELPDEDLDWEPRPFARGLRSGRRFRWSVVLMAATLAGALGYGWVRLLHLPEDAVEQRQSEYTVTLTELAAALPELETAASLAADPSPGTASRALAPLVAAEDAAERAHGIAARPLPATPPILGRSIVETLQPGRRHLLEAAGVTRTVVGQVRSLVAYRLAWERSFQVPGLPRTANGAATDELDAVLSVMAAETAAAVSDLPDVPLLDGHHQAAVSLVESLPGWQTEYLTALRIGADEHASFLVADLRARLDDLEELFLAGLADIDAAVSRSTAELRARIDLAAIAVVG